MSEQLGPQDEALSSVAKIIGELTNEAANETQKRIVENDLHEELAQLISEKGKKQTPDERDLAERSDPAIPRQYIRGYTDPVPMETPIGKVRVTVHETVRVDNFRQVGEEVATPTGYHIQFQAGGEYSPFTIMFHIDTWHNHNRGWRGQDLNLAETKMALGIVRFVNKSLPAIG